MVPSAPAGGPLPGLGGFLAHVLSLGDCLQLSSCRGPVLWWRDAGCLDLLRLGALLISGMRPPQLLLPARGLEPMGSKAGQSHSPPRVFPLLQGSLSRVAWRPVFPLRL